MKHVFALFLILVLASGCTGVMEQFGKDVVTVTEEEKVEGSADTVIITDIRIEEGSTLLPEQAATLSFTIENMDAEKTASGVVAELFDPSLFDCADDCLPDYCRPEGNTPGPCDIPPGGQRRVKFDLIAPDEERIGNLIVDVTPTFSVKYDFHNTLSYEVKVVNEEEVTRLRRLGEKITFNTGKTIGSGPVKLDARLKGTTGFILAGQEAGIIFTIRDQGTQGTLVGSKIEASDGKGVTLSFGGLSATGPDRLFNGGLTNTEEITLYQGESDPLIFTISPVPSQEVTTYKSFYVQGRVDYQYEMRGSVKVTVAPWRT